MPHALHLDQHLAEAGLGLGHVVADEQLAVAQRDGPHASPQLRALPVGRRLLLDVGL